MKINTIEETLLAYKNHKELAEKYTKENCDTTPDFENISKVLNNLVEEIKETATINEIDTILKLIDIYKTTKVFWLKDVIDDILNKGHWSMSELPEEFKEPKVPYPFNPDVPPTLPDPHNLNTVWCENKK